MAECKDCLNALEVLKSDIDELESAVERLEEKLLEQTQSARNGHIALLWTAIVGLFVAAGGEFLAGHFNK